MSGVPWVARGALAADKGTEVLIACDSIGHSAHNGPIVVTKPGWVKWGQVTDKQTFSVDLPFLGHTVTQNPVRKNEVITFEKWGQRGALVDVTTRKVLAMASSSDNHLFFGHAAYNPDGDTVYVVEEGYNHQIGKLVIRQASDLKIVDTLSSHGIRPHDCRLLPDGTTLLICNEGYRDQGKPSLTWVNRKTGKLEKEVLFDPNVPGHYAVPIFGGVSHFDISYDDWICCGGIGFVPSSTEEHKPTFAIIAFVSPKGEVHFPDLPVELTSQMHGEALSIAVLGQSGLVAITLPDANMCLIFDYKTQKLVTRIDTQKSTGVVADIHNSDKLGFIMSGGEGLRQVQINAEKAEAVPKPSLPDISLHGAHLNRIYI